MFCWSGVCSIRQQPDPAGPHRPALTCSCASQVWGSWGLTHGPVLWLSFHFLVAVAQNSDHGLSSRLATGLRSVVQPRGCCRCGPVSGSAFPVFPCGLPDLSASAASSFRDLSFCLSRARRGCLGEGCSWGWKPLPPASPCKLGHAVFTAPQTFSVSFLIRVSVSAPMFNQRLLDFLTLCLLK